LSAVENAFVLAGQTAKCSEMGGRRTRERQVCLRLPEEIIVDRDDACRRMHSLIVRAHAIAR